MGRNNRVEHLARVLSVMVGEHANPQTTGDWLNAILNEDAHPEELEIATASLISALRDRKAAIRLLASRAIEASRKKD
jgi:hypothetical protein